jgi:hypothetical protein
MVKKKKKTATRRKPTPADDIQQILWHPEECHHIMTYRQARDMCSSFATTIYNATAEESTELEMEMVKTAGKEIIELLKDKYDMCPTNAAPMLLLMGMSMLQELDRHTDELNNGRV